MIRTPEQNIPFETIDLDDLNKSFEFYDETEKLFLSK